MNLLNVLYLELLYTDNTLSSGNTHSLNPFSLQGSVAIAGAVIRWLRDNLGIIKSSEEIGEYALVKS